MDKGASGHRYGRSFGYGEMMGLVGAGAGGWLYDQPWALVIPWGAMLEGQSGPGHVGAPRKFAHTGEMAQNGAWDGTALVQ